MKLKNIFLVLIMCTMIILVGCTRKVEKIGGNDQNKTNNSKVDNKKEKKDQADKQKEQDNIENVKTAVLYFPDDNAEFIIPEARIIKSYDPILLLNELQKGSIIQNKTYMFSNDIKIKDVKVKDKIAIINFDESIYGKINGTAGETLTLASIVNTLTLNKPLGVDKVRFEVNGIPMETLGGHVDISLPLGPMKEYIVK